VKIVNINVRGDDSLWVEYDTALKYMNFTQEPPPYAVEDPSGKGPNPRVKRDDQEQSDKVASVAATQSGWGTGLARTILRKIKRLVGGERGQPGTPNERSQKLREPPNPSTGLHRLSPAVTASLLVRLDSEFAHGKMKPGEVTNINDACPRPSIRRLQDKRADVLAKEDGRKTPDSSMKAHEAGNVARPSLHNENRTRAGFPLRELPPTYEASEEAARKGMMARSRPVYERSLVQDAQARQQLIAGRSEQSDSYTR